MKVEITNLFYDNATISKAYAQAQSPTGFVATWSTIAKLMLQSGAPRIRAPKINEVSKIVDLGSFDQPSFQAMKDNGMILETDLKLPSTLSTNCFDEWWKSYPYRDVNGKKIKVGRKNAQRRFDNQIRNLEIFAQLMEATANYSTVCDKKPRDAERFLKDDFYKEFLDITPTTSIAKQTKELQTIDLDRMLND